MIGDALWYLGASSPFIRPTTHDFYEHERGIAVYTGRATSWVGKVGLMYPSDYGYAMSGGTTTDRNTCLNTDLWFSISNLSDCYNNNWIRNPDFAFWTLTSHNTDNSVFILADDYIDLVFGVASINLGVKTVVYLKSSVKITNGKGSKSNPYELSV